MIEQDSIQYRYPDLELLNPSKAVSNDDLTEDLKNTAQTIIDTLKSFGIRTHIVDIYRGPTITRYEIQPVAGVQVSKIIRLANDIALNLASSHVIIAPVPGKSVIGVDVPNKVASVVSIRDVFDSLEFKGADTCVPIALGKDMIGNAIVVDISEMNHLLITGITGSGKSVCLNSVIMSLIYKTTPDAVKLLLIDPKVIELGPYNGIPHLLIPVVTDTRKAAGALGWAVMEMRNRYSLFTERQVRDLNGYNQLALMSDNFAPMPKIVIMLDGLSDLILPEIEDSINLLAQLGAAAGMHLVVATQHLPRGTLAEAIKSNIPSRITFATSSQAESRAIINTVGAERLSGRGDMLFLPMGTTQPLRVQGSYASHDEIEKVVAFFKQNESADYDQAIMEKVDPPVPNRDGLEEEDDMLPLAIECVIEMGQASTSMLQRRLKLNYARAARIIDQLEQKGIVGPFEGSKPRQVFISKERWIEMKLSGVEINSNDDENVSQSHITQPKIDVPTDYPPAEPIQTSPTIDSEEHRMRQINQRKRQGLCIYCAGQLSGFLRKKCKSCGRPN